MREYFEQGYVVAAVEHGRDKYWSDAMPVEAVLADYHNGEG